MRERFRLEVGARPVRLALALLVSGWLAASASAEDLRETRERLLEDTPNFVEALRSSWSTLRADDLYGRYFGLLTDESDEREVTLEQSIALALQNNTGLRIGRLNPVLATNEVRRARAAFDPEVFAEVGKTRSVSSVSSSSPFTAQQRETFQEEVVWDVGLRKPLISGGAVSLEWTNNKLSRPPNVLTLLVPEYNTQVNLSLNQPLLRNFGWRYALLNVDVAQTVEIAAFYEFKAQVANLVSTVEQLYWTLVLADANVEVEEQGLELARELLRQNQGRFEVGALPRTAVLESEAEVARREANLVRARNAQRIARDRLSNVVNARDDASQQVSLLVPTDRPSLAEYRVDTRNSLERALVSRPELIAARLDVNSKRLLEKAAKNQLLPRLDLVALIGLNGIGGDDAGPFSFSEDLTPEECARLREMGMDTGSCIFADPRVDGGYSSALNLLTDGRFYQYNFGLQLEVPLNNAAAEAEYVESRIEAERSQLSLRELEESVTLEIKSAVDSIRSHLKSIEATRVARRLAEENLRNQKARYDVGLATTKDLIDFQERLTRARQEEIAALTRYNTDLAELRRADGTLLDHRNIQLRRPTAEDAPWWTWF